MHGEESVDPPPPESGSQITVLICNLGRGQQLEAEITIRGTGVVAPHVSRDIPRNEGFLARKVRVRA